MTSKIDKLTLGQIKQAREDFICGLYNAVLKYAEEYEAATGLEVHDCYVELTRKFKRSTRDIFNLTPLNAHSGDMRFVGEEEYYPEDDAEVDTEENDW
jgi:hypothetical protein